jgi:hypothetical protein
MLMNEFWTSETLAHWPALAWNSCVTTKKFCTVPIAVCPRNRHSKDQLWQFRRTAKAVQDAPWQFLSASLIRMSLVTVQCPAADVPAQAFQQHRWAKAVWPFPPGLWSQMSGSAMHGLPRHPSPSQGLFLASGPNKWASWSSAAVGHEMDQAGDNCCPAVDEGAGIRWLAQAAPCTDAAAAELTPCNCTMTRWRLGLVRLLWATPFSCLAAGVPKCKRNSNGCKQCTNISRRLHGPCKASGAL